MSEFHLENSAPFFVALPKTLLVALFRSHDSHLGYPGLARADRSNDYCEADNAQLLGGFYGEQYARALWN